MENVALDESFWAGRSVLLTGHTGFKGSWLLLLLERLGARVTGISLDPVTSPALFNQIGGNARCDHHIVDIRDRAAVAAITADANPEIIMHLAAQPLVRRSYADPVETFSTNVLGTANVLEAARKLDKLRAIVSVTTDKCYANDGRVEGYDEDARLGGHDPYSSSKACAELVSQSYRDSFFAARGIGLATARAGNVIGGGDYSDDRLIPDTVRAFRSGTPVAVRNPDAVRPWQHVLEPLAGYCLLAQKMSASPENYAGGWNFGPPTADTAPVSHVVEILAECWGQSEGYVRQRGEHPHEAAMLTLDSTKALRELGWKSRLTLEEAIGWSAKWYRQVDDGADAATVANAQIDEYFGLRKFAGLQAAA